MLTFITPRDRLLLRFLKPKVAAWRWFAKAKGLVGISAESHEFLERAMNEQIENYDSYSMIGGFKFQDGQYLLKLQTADGIVNRYCSSLLEVAVIVSFKFKVWKGPVLSLTPPFSTAALNATSPSDFISRLLGLLREERLDKLRRLWLVYLTTERDSDASRLSQVKCITGILSGNYAAVHSEVDVGEKYSADLVSLGIDKKQAYDDIFDLMHPLILKELQLDRPHAYHLYSICESEDELRRLLSGDMGFLRGRMAMMCAEQREYMFGSELGL
ncbi:hypothetical protein [Pseudomonas putida]|uniref:Uncharacterized protein n=1 Tax=Pseudomonas putida TaxID=303 RepID=A0A1Q9QUI0_PSEPU|nr:hypothetical protein [Pseudomonas putida]OLS58798.1 hypothetical protein PSEMO_61590 [Pseudomonas putida]